MYVAMLMFLYFQSDYGDVYSRKSTKVKKESEAMIPQCIIRASGTGQSNSISTVVDATCCDVFQKRMSQILKSNILRSKPRKSRSGSQ